MKQGNTKMAGYILALIVYVLGIAIFTTLLAKIMSANFLTNAMENGAITAVVFLSALFANWIGLRNGQGKHLIMSSINACIMISCLFIVGAGFEGAYRNIGIRIATIIIGVGISTVTCLRKTRKSNVKKRRSR